jgi:hypothetical protein
VIQLDEVEQEIIVLCAEDSMGLWFIAGTVRDMQFAPDSDTSAVCTRTLEILSRLLASGLIEAGFPDRSGRFVPASESSE